jgi:hypothetical protein
LCSFCSLAVAPCADCGETWAGPCPQCLAPNELMQPVLL